MNLTDITLTASLRYRLSHIIHEFDFVDGSILWPPARSIAEIFGSEANAVDCYSYFNESAFSILAAVENLASYVIDNGPFDGVLGFSQGAVLAATLLIAVQASAETLGSKSEPGSELLAALFPLRMQRQPPFRCAVFLCGGYPFDVCALQRGEIVEITERPCRDGGDRSLIDIPVVNCWASNDKDYPGMGPPLSTLCGESTNQEVVHGAGHGVPSEGEDLDALCRAIERVTGSAM
ncbi:serine hydrolase FSH [Aspergillus filifer]